MIKAEHNKAARLIFDVYIDRLLKKNFSSFFLVNECPEIKNINSLIVTPNHFSWWDGFFIDLVNRKVLRRKIHIMMLEDQLKKYWFFRYLGAYSVRQENPKCIIETAAYSREISDIPGTLNVIYPQGEIESYEKRPLSFKFGLRFFLRGIAGNSAVAPVLFKIKYGEVMKPSVYCWFGELVSPKDVIADFARYLKNLEYGLDQLNILSERKTSMKDLFRNEL
ncbi:MAG: lysophospholipid acyltransferase family protein [Bacteroidota bacterium]|nr:lysophospholipid acyltransferase family protein [Bacteroidota bacterium]MDP4196272.1 lysophospholipid acyltransferase family protein [Bacteroidota bacterium]